MLLLQPPISKFMGENSKSDKSENGSQSHPARSHTANRFCLSPKIIHRHPSSLWRAWKHGNCCLSLPSSWYAHSSLWMFLGKLKWVTLPCWAMEKTQTVQTSHQEAIYLLCFCVFICQSFSSPSVFIFLFNTMLFLCDWLLVWRRENLESTWKKKIQPILSIIYDQNDLVWLLGAGRSHH